MVLLEAEEVGAEGPPEGASQLATLDTGSEHVPVGSQLARPADTACGASASDGPADSGGPAPVLIQKYSWVDEKAAVKVYINETSNEAAIAAAGDGKCSEVEADFKPRSFTITIKGGDRQCFVLTLRGLHHDVVPEQCKVRVSAGKRITVTLVKRVERPWRELSEKTW